MILKTFLCFLWAQVTCLLAVGIACADCILLPDLKFSELGLVENAQALLLLLTSALYLRTALRQNNRFYILVSGFLCCMLIRELDFFLDKLHHGIWFYFSLAAAAGFIFAGLRQGMNRAISDMRLSLSRSSFIWMLAGLTVVLCFSRLIGMHHLWDLAVAEQFFYAIKRIAEETTELWGYFLIFTSALFLRFD